MQLEFKTKTDAENSEVFKSKEFYRFYKNMNTQIYIIETIDFGTILSHFDLISLGNKYLTTTKNI